MTQGVKETSSQFRVTTSSRILIRPCRLIPSRVTASARAKHVTMICRMGPRFILETKFILKIIAREMLNDIEGFAVIVVVIELNRTDGSGDLQRGFVQLHITFANAHERPAHRKLYRAFLFIE